MKNKKKHSRVKRVFTIAGLIIIGLIILGFAYEQISEFVDARTLKPPGEMVQVGDHDLHIYCTGTNVNNNPTVILEAGGGDNYTTWHRVQPEISKYTKVCSYDRSGLGFSQRTTDQRTNADIVGELETLLNNANVNGPYIVVGHSIGGIYTRLFTKQNISQIKGLVQIDPGVEEMAKFDNEPTPLIMNIQSGIIEFLFRIGVARIVMHLDPKIASIDPDIANIEIAFKSTMMINKNKYPEGYKTFDNIQEIESASNFGMLPVVVFSADQSEQQAIASFGENAKNWHADLAKKLSNNSKYIMVENSSHYIQNDQPQIIIDQIRSLMN